MFNRPANSVVSTAKEVDLPNFAIPCFFPVPSPRKKLDFIFFDAGGGHRSAANALKSVIEQQQRPWDIRLVNLQEVLRPLDIFRKVTGLPMEDVYNLLLRTGWTLGSPQPTKILHGLIPVPLAPSARR